VYVCVRARAEWGVTLEMLRCSPSLRYGIISSVIEFSVLPFHPYN